MGRIARLDRPPAGRAPGMVRVNPDQRTFEEPTSGSVLLKVSASPWQDSPLETRHRRGQKNGLPRYLAKCRPANPIPSASLLSAPASALCLTTGYMPEGSQPSRGQRITPNKEKVTIQITALQIAQYIVISRITASSCHANRQPALQIRRHRPMPPDTTGSAQPLGYCSPIGYRFEKLIVKWLH